MRGKINSGGQKTNHDHNYQQPVLKSKLEYKRIEFI